MAKVEVQVKDKVLVNIDEAAALLGTSAPTIKKLAKMGIIPFLKLGNGIRIRMADIDKALESIMYKQVDLDELKLLDIDYSEIASS